MTTICRHLMGFYSELSDKKADPRVEHLPLMSSPLPVVGLVLFYIFFVNKMGPEIMKKREPFVLRYFMILFNTVQVVVNVYIFLLSTAIAYIKLRYSLFCQEVDYSDEPIPRLISNTVWLYFFVKILDLLDTVIMVLRKKERQISFLHVYHHTGMVLAGWVATKYLAGGHAIFIGTVNTFVHAVMYSYYLLTVLYPEYKKSIWWKKHLTELQMVQFIILSWHSAIAIVNPYCNFPKAPLGIFFPQNIFMLFMFWDFYKKNYLLEKKVNDIERLKCQTEENNNVAKDKKTN